MGNDVEKRITAKMVLDSTGFNDSLKGVNQQLKLAQSEFKASSAQVGVFGNETDKLKTKSEGLNKQIELQKQKVDIYKDSIQKSTQKLQETIKARDDLKVKLQEETAKYNDVIKLYGKESDEASKAKESVNKLTEEYNKKEKQVESTAKSINTYTVNMNKADAELFKMQGELRSTNKELATHESKLINAGKAMESASEKMKSAGEKISGVGDKLSIGVTAPILGIGIAAGKMAMDAVESENLFEVSMGDMAKSAREWSDKTSKALGLNAYAVRENIGTFNVMLTSMGQTKQQALNMSEGLTQLAYDMASFYNLKPEEAFDKLKSGISGETEPLKSLGILINDTQVKTYALTKGIIKQGQEMTDAQKVQARYGLIMQATTKAQGDLARTMDSPTNKLRIQSEQIKQAGIELGTKLLPLLSKGLDIIKPIIEHLNNMTDAQQEALLKTLMFTAAIGPALSLGGKVISTGGSVIGVIGKLSGALGTATVATEGIGAAAGVAAGAGGIGGLAGLGTALGGAVVAAAPFVVAGVAVAGVGYGINKALTQEAVPAIDLFADKVEYTTKNVTGDYYNMAANIETNTTKISDSTKKAVGAYIKLDDDAKKSLADLYVNGTAITDKTTKDIVTKYNNMVIQIKAGMDKHFNDEYNTMQQFFQKNSALTNDEETKALANLQKSNADKKAEIDKYSKDIQAILIKASNEKRAITLDEQQQINSIQEKMKINAVKILSDSEVESKVILERLKDYGTRITAEQASNEIKNANNARDGSVKAANEQYNKTMAEIIRMRDESHSITADQANKLIAEAQRQKDESIKKANELRDGVVSKITDMNSDIETKVDTNSGKILTVWDKLKRWWTGWKPESKNFSYVVSGAQYGSRGMLYENAAGNSSFEGGLTTLHEKGYEVYDLPQGTRIYNHDASEDLVLKTAGAIASRMASGVSSNVNHTGTIRVEGVNEQGQLMAVVDIVMDQLRREIRA